LHVFDFKKYDYIIDKQAQYAYQQMSKNMLSAYAKIIIFYGF